MNQRTSGVLMHITSLPGTQGVGTFGKEAYEFVDFLVETDQTYWQILPLTTTSYGDSPYQSFSATAGNTHLIDLEQLADQGFLDRAAFEGVNFGDDVESVDYARIFDLRRPILEQAVKGFLSNPARVEELAQQRKKHHQIRQHLQQPAFQERQATVLRLTILLFCNAILAVCLIMKVQLQTQATQLGPLHQVSLKKSLIPHTHVAISQEMTLS